MATQPATTAATAPAATAPAPPALTPQAAIQAIMATHPAAAAVLSQIVNKDIIALATDEAFALRDNNGEIRAFKQALTLSEKAGTLIQPVPGGGYVVSAQGYEVWQEAVGANVIFPSEVLVDGKWQPNPAVIRDTNNGRILMIYARAVAFRFSSKGIPMVSDWTTIYDTPSYRMIDLLGKAKKTPQAFQLLPIEMKPENDEKTTWACYKFDEATNVWMNTKHEEALSWLSSIINREKKSIDFAQTFAKRNALKHLSGIQKAPSNVWTIPVISWRPVNGNIIKWDATQYANLQARVGKLVSGDRSEFAQIEMQKGAERVSDDDGAAAVMEAEDPEDVAIDIPVTNSAPLTDEDKKALANLATTKKMFPDEYGKVCVALGIKAADEVTNPELAQKMYLEVSKLVGG